MDITWDSSLVWSTEIESSAGYGSITGRLSMASPVILYAYRIQPDVAWPPRNLLITLLTQPIILKSLSANSWNAQRRMHLVMRSIEITGSRGFFFCRSEFHLLFTMWNGFSSVDYLRNRMSHILSWSSLDYRNVLDSLTGIENELLIQRAVAFLTAVVSGASKGSYMLVHAQERHNTYLICFLGILSFHPAFWIGNTKTTAQWWRNSKLHLYK